MKKLTIFFIVLGIFAFVSPASAGLEDGLRAYYPFNGNANDESGSGNDGIVYGATLTEDRFINSDSAYSFDGVDDYIDVGDDNSLKMTDAITISAWVKINSFSSTKISWKSFVDNNPDRIKEQI